jgi:hypothetical protein
MPFGERDAGFERRARSIIAVVAGGLELLPCYHVLVAAQDAKTAEPYDREKRRLIRANVATYTCV